MDETAYWDLITVPRRAWDPTEGVHPRHDERSFASINRVEVHWPAAYDLDDHGDSASELASWEAFHEVTKGWSDLFYNVVGDTEGDIYEGRDITVASQSDLGNVMTMLIHHGIDDDLTDPERDTFGFLIWKAWSAVTDGTCDPAGLGYHSERAVTGCPGDHLRAIVNDLRAGWVPPQATKGTPDMYLEHRTDTNEFFVVRPSGRAKVSSPDHWRQVIKAGLATGEYKSDFFQELDAITTPYQVAQTGQVLVTELDDGEVARIANAVVANLPAHPDSAPLPQVEVDRIADAVLDRQAQRLQE